MPRRKGSVPPKERNWLERAFRADLWDEKGRPLFPIHVSRMSRAVYRRFPDTEPSRSELIQYFRSDAFLKNASDVGAGTVRWVYRMMRLGLPPSLDLSALDDLLASFPDLTIQPSPNKGYRAQLGEWVGYGSTASNAVVSVVHQFRTGAPA